MGDNITAFTWYFSLYNPACDLAGIICNVGDNGTKCLRLCVVFSTRLDGIIFQNCFILNTKYFCFQTAWLFWLPQSQSDKKGWRPALSFSFSLSFPPWAWKSKAWPRDCSLWKKTHSFLFLHTPLFIYTPVSPTGSWLWRSHYSMFVHQSSILIIILWERYYYH